MVSFLGVEDKKKIIEAIRQVEKTTSGEIRVHVVGKCKEDAMKEAKKVFERLGMHRTQHRNAVLIFVALKSRRFAVFGDQGIHERVGESFWLRTKEILSDYLSKNQMRQGIVAATYSIGEQLERFFPRSADQNPNELSDRVTEG